MDYLAALRSADIAQPGYELSLIYEEVTGIAASQARLHAPILNALQQTQCEKIMARRMAGEPLHRIFGWREFWGLRLRLSPATLEPRPDSETLIEAVLKHLPNRSAPLSILDLGTGTGCLLLSILKEYQYAKGIGIDISSLAISTAAANAKSLNLFTRAQFYLSDWEKPDWIEKLPSSSSRRLGDPKKPSLDPYARRENDNKFDLIISNPPYIETTAALPFDVKNHDPHRALFAGIDGLDAYKIILAGLPQLLSPNGLAVIELGASQAAAVSQIATDNQLNVIDICRDLGGHERCLVLRHAVI